MTDQASAVVTNPSTGDWNVVPSDVSNPEHLVASACLVNLVKWAADELEKEFPQWLWAIRPDEGGGVVDIMCLRISTKFGYTLHISRLQQYQRMAVIKAGGEFLERFGFRRVGYSHEEWQRREMVLGQFIPDVSDMQRMRQKNFQTETLQAALKTGHAAITTDDRVGLALRSAGRGA